jgi:dipeptidyl aminopeptidase/acylaminoacyl peptidase
MTDPSPTNGNGTRWSWRGRRLRLTVLGLSLVAVFLAVVGPISFWNRGGPPAVLPDTQMQFSLDLKVVGSMKHDVVYAVEQRARPKYRIFAFDPNTGVDSTVFTVPTNGIVYSIALSPDRKTLAVSYSPDFHINGSGLSLLDTTTKSFTELTSATTGLFDVDLEWAPDGRSIYSTRVDQRVAVERLAIARTDAATGKVTTVVESGVDPAFNGDQLFYLEVDKARARHTIRSIDRPDAINVTDQTVDLDHLLSGPDETKLRVGVLTPAQAPSITVGTAASAHGNHDVPSTWWQITDGSQRRSAPLGIDPTIVYDATSRNESIVYATQEGLSIAVGSTRTDLIASRAIRLVSG